MLETIGSVQAIHFIGTGWDFLGFPLLHAARSLGVPFTVFPATHPGSWGDDLIDARLYARADAVFCLSEFEADHLKRIGVAADRIARCGLPPMCRMDGNRKRFRQKYELTNRPTALFLGRRDEGKGYRAVLEAWKRVLRELPDAVLLLAGPSKDASGDCLGGCPSGSIRDLGTPNELEKADALAGCDVFCLPSAHESFGIVYVEAWAYGKPVICGTAPASQELVEDGKTGLWSDGTPDSIAAKLIAMLGCPSLSAEMGSAGQKLQRHHYTSEAMVETHLSAWAFIAN